MNLVYGHQMRDTAGAVAEQWGGEGVLVEVINSMLPCQESATAYEGITIFARSDAALE